jgi:hypothetical protein
MCSNTLTTPSEKPRRRSSLLTVIKREIFIW